MAADEEEISIYMEALKEGRCAVAEKMYYRMEEKNYSDMSDLDRILFISDQLMSLSIAEGRIDREEYAHG